MVCRFVAARRGRRAAYVGCLEGPVNCFVGVRFRFRPFARDTEVRFSFHCFCSIVRRAGNFVVLTANGRFVGLRSSCFDRVGVLAGHVVHLLFFVLFWRRVSLAGSWLVSVANSLSCFGGFVGRFRHFFYQLGQGVSLRRRFICVVGVVFAGGECFDGLARTLGCLRLLYLDNFEVFGRFRRRVSYLFAVIEEEGAVVVRGFVVVIFASKAGCLGDCNGEVVRDFRVRGRVHFLRGDIRLVRGDFPIAIMVVVAVIVAEPFVMAESFGGFLGFGSMVFSL